MSVLACDRGRCDHIMCDRLILDRSKYICHDCWQELLAYKAKWPADMSVADVRTRIEEFMETDPGSHVAANVDEEFERLTRSGLSE